MLKSWMSNKNKPITHFAYIYYRQLMFIKNLK